MRLEPESVTGKNKFVEITLAKTLELAWEIIHETAKDPKDAGMELLRRIRGDGGMLEIKVFADNDFYSQREQVRSSLL